MKRRDFLMCSLMSTPVLVAEVSPLSLVRSGPVKSWGTGLKLSFQEGTAPGKCLEEKFDFMEEYGIEGFEPRGGDLINCAGEYINLLRYRNISISAVYSGLKGFVLSHNKVVRDRYKPIIRDIIAIAGGLGSSGVIITPGTYGQITGLNKFLKEQLSELSEYAEKHNTSVILEPLIRKETTGIHTVAEAAGICRSAGRKGLRCMGDFWHMTREEISDLEAFRSGGEFLSHVHIASRKTRYLPGTDGIYDNYIEGFKGLKEIKYKGFISYKCGINGDKAASVPASVNFLRRQWDSC
jgi:sugar phosphate isomerase/epimerase